MQKPRMAYLRHPGFLAGHPPRAPRYVEASRLAVLLVLAALLPLILLLTLAALAAAP